MGRFFKFKERPSKQTEHAKLEAKVDAAFSEYIRLRDCDEKGNVICITCSDKHHWKDIDCGHYMRRGNMSIRWDIKNSHGQCRLCNSTIDGREEDHGRAIDLRYGAGTAEALQKLSRQDTKFLEHELKGMLDELRKEIKALKEEKEMV
jgi:hypothetical protein